MSDIYDPANKFKSRLAARERRAASELLRAYGLAYQRIALRVQTLTDEITELRRKGQVVTANFLYERDRLALLLAEVETEMDRFSAASVLKVTNEQRAVMSLAATDARHLILQAAEESGEQLFPNTLQSGTAETVAGYASDGSPLRKLFDDMGRGVSRRIRDELIAGVAQNAPARVIAARLRSASALGLSRSMTITRTEIIRAYRDRVHATYRANASLLRGWVWTATRTGRTCAMCIAMDGRVFPTSRRLQSHPNCRCVPAPLTLRAPTPQTGEAWFDEQEEGLQRQVLGDAKFAAFKSGKLKLNDLVGVRRSERWGNTPFERSLRDAVQS